MRWTLLVDSPDLVQRMRAWVRRHPALAQLIPRLFGQLAADPDAHPVQTSTLIRHTTAYTFILAPEGGLLETVHLTFHVERRESEGVLAVVGGVMGGERFPD